MVGFSCPIFLKVLWYGMLGDMPNHHLLPSLGTVLHSRTCLLCPSLHVERETTCWHALPEIGIRDHSFSGLCKAQTMGPWYMGPTLYLCTNVEVSSFVQK